MTLNGSGAALAAARREITQRLRAVCDYCTDAEFDRLVARIAAIEVKYEMRDILELLCPATAGSGVTIHAAEHDPGPVTDRSKGMNSAA